MLKRRRLIAVMCICPVMLFLLSGQGCPPIPTQGSGNGNSGQNTSSGCNSNRPPVANAGPDIEVALGDRAFLDGNSSSDIDGDSLSYRWQMVRGPDTIVPDSANSANPSFIPPVAGVYGFGI